MRNMVATLLLSIVAISTLTLAAAAPNSSESSSATSTGSDSSMVSRGHTLFLSNCSPCHGAQAQGDDGPNLHHLGLPASAIASQVINGTKDEMPPFKSKLKGVDLQAVVAYVHSLQ